LAIEVIDLPIVGLIAAVLSLGIFVSIGGGSPPVLLDRARDACGRVFRSR